MGNVIIKTGESLVTQAYSNLTIDQKTTVSYPLEWEDLKFPASGINPPGQASDPTLTTHGTLSFAGDADNIIAGVAQMPHAWREGSSLRAHLHLRFPTSASANTRWKIEWDRSNVNGNFESAVGSYANTETITVANPQATAKHVIVGFTDWTMTGYLLSTIILWKITRLANSDAADNHTAAVELLEFDIHYQSDNRGSREEFRKEAPQTI